MLRRECQRIISGKTVAKVAIVGGGRKQNGRLGAEDVAKLLYGAKIANMWRNFQVANRAQGADMGDFRGYRRSDKRRKGANREGDNGRQGMKFR